MMEEYVEIVGTSKKPIGIAKRKVCHGHPKLTHMTVHVIINDNKNRVLLQKRSLTKDILPGMWDTAVGGHLEPGERVVDGAVREMNEELGLPLDLKLDYLFEIEEHNKIESEIIHVFKAFYEGPFNFQHDEIDEIGFFDKGGICKLMKEKLLTPLCVKELKILKIIKA